MYEFSNRHISLSAANQASMSQWWYVESYQTNIVTLILKAMISHVIMTLEQQFITFARAWNGKESVTLHGSYHLVAIDYYESFLFEGSFKLQVSHRLRWKLAFLINPLHGCESVLAQMMLLRPCFSSFCSIPNFKCSWFQEFYFHQSQSGPPSNTKIINIRYYDDVTHFIYNITTCNFSSFCFVFIWTSIHVYSYIQKVFKPWQNWKLNLYF